MSPALRPSGTPLRTHALQLPAPRDPQTERGGIVTIQLPGAGLSPPAEQPRRRAGRDAGPPRHDYARAGDVQAGSPGVAAANDVIAVGDGAAGSVMDADARAGRSDAGHRTLPSQTTRASQIPTRTVVGECLTDWLLELMRRGGRYGRRAGTGRIRIGSTHAFAWEADFTLIAHAVAADSVELIADARLALFVAVARVGVG
jgi:hypothetical protein